MASLRPRFLLVLVLPWLAALAGSCGGDDGDGKGDGGGGSGLLGRTFLLDAAEGFTPVAGTTLRVSFREAEEGPQFGFNAGCNSHFGAYSLQAGRLLLTDLGATAIGCDAARSQQDSSLADFFTGSPMIELDGDELTFMGDEVTLVFLDREVADPDRPLAGRVWVIDTFIDGDAASNLGLSEDPTVQFDDDGTIDVFSGCNSGRGSYDRQGDALTLSGLAYTERGCPDAAQLSAEQMVQAVLSEGTVSFEIEAARLTLMRGTQGLGARTE